MAKGKPTAPEKRIAWGRYLLVFFVAAWMFVLGILVGRGNAPVQFNIESLQEELARLRQGSAQKEREAVERAMRGEDDNTPLEFYEALKNDEPDRVVKMRPVPRPPKAPASPASKPKPAPPENKPKPASPTHKKPAALMAKEEKAAAKPVARQPRPAKSTAQSRPSVPVVSRGQLTIQVASLKDGEAAERIVANLKKDGYPAYLSRIVIPDRGLWFRVRVGHYASHDQAASDLKRLTNSNRKPFLVKTN